MAAAEILEELERKLAALESERRGRAKTSRGIEPLETQEQVYSTGLKTLDEMLPLRGIRPGSLVEWLAVQEGVGAEWLAFRAAAEVCRSLDSVGRCLVVDPRGDFYPLAVQGFGLQPRDLVIVRPKNAKEELWAYDQALRSGSIQVVVGWIDRLADTPFRRLQLAAEKSGSLGFLLRPAAVRNKPSWAEVRFLVDSVPVAQRLFDLSPPVLRPGSAGPPVPHGGAGLPFRLFPQEQSSVRPGRHFRIQVLRCPGGKPPAGKDIRVDEETGAVRLVPSLAGATAAFRQAGA
jgi:hypothetical protein